MYHNQTLTISVRRYIVVQCPLWTIETVNINFLVLMNGLIMMLAKQSHPTYSDIASSTIGHLTKTGKFYMSRYLVLSYQFPWLPLTYSVKLNVMPRELIIYSIVGSDGITKFTVKIHPF